jgi:hypothetical protein
MWTRASTIDSNITCTSQYDYKRHCTSTSSLSQDYPNAYADELEDDDWYEQDYLKNSYDEHMGRYGKSRLFNGKEYLNISQALRGYRSTY